MKVTFTVENDTSQFTLTSNKIVMSFQLILKRTGTTSNKITKYGCLKHLVYW
jgi:hypothetical protein